MAFVLYSIAEATQRYNTEADSTCREETLRNRMKTAGLMIHKIGNLDLIAEDELIRLIHMEPPKKGRPPIGTGVTPSLTCGLT